MQTAYAYTERPSIRLRTTPVQTSDSELIAAVAKGEKAAMHALFVRHNVRVYRFILRITGNASLAEDLVSDVFLDVWRKAGQFEQRSQVSTWLLAIARLKAISAMRRRPHDELDEQALAQIEDPGENADVMLERQERFTLLRKCLANVSPAHREIIDLVYYHGKSVAEASVIVGIPQASVKTRMFYARQRLGELLQQAEAGCVLS
jgi:RNA polymerase sigma-70 factor (ECF subfamily)